ncbi:MAG: OB-fold nucleic acid binding domain-containing protein [Nanoarchaeota archaeon]
MPEQEFKRHIAYKFSIGDIISGKIVMDGERFKLIEIGPKRVSRVNIIANVIDKFIQDGEKKYGTLTLDDASGQLRVKVFGEDLAKLEQFIQGDTLMIIGLVRLWNNELYLTPEIIKKKEPSYLLVRKLELDAEKPKMLEKNEMQQLKESILSLVKQEDDKGGVEIERMILDFKASPDVINQEVKKLLEEGIVYEPRPGKLRYLG